MGGRMFSPPPPPARANSWSLDLHEERVGLTCSVHAFSCRRTAVDCLPRAFPDRVSAGKLQSAHVVCGGRSSAAVPGKRFEAEPDGQRDFCRAAGDGAGGGFDAGSETGVGHSSAHGGFDFSGRGRLGCFVAQLRRHGRSLWRNGVHRTGIGGGRLGHPGGAEGCVPVPF